MVVSDFFIPNTREWDVEVIREVFSPAECERILRTTPTPPDARDTLIWHFAPKGVYTVKSAYTLAMNMINERSPSESSPWQTLWSFKVPPRLKSFYWRLCRGFLAVKAKTGRWYPGTGSVCPVCESPGLVESVWHLFIDCSFARSCWVMSGLWQKLDELCYEMDNAQDLFLYVLSHFSREDSEKIMATTWAMWRHRNLVVWDESHMNPAQVLHSAAWALSEWKEVRMPASTKTSTTRCKLWHRPPVVYLKINVDASFFDSSFRTGVGMVIRDEDGHCLEFRTLCRDGLLRVEEGEAWGVIEALQWAEQKGYHEVIIESDAKRVVDAYACNELDDSVLGDFIKSGKRILSENPHFYVRWVSRNANIVAHTLARAARDYDSPHYWNEPPIFVEGLSDICYSCL